MISFVLSGGGIRGPIQIGALEALFAHDLWPDFLVGTSAGAINAAFVAAAGHPSCSGDLARAWRKGAKDIVYPGNIFSMAWRVLTGADGIFPSDGMRRLIEENLPADTRTFGDLKVPCYLTAVDLQSSRLYLFGEDPAAPLVDAIMASCSIPVYQAPVDYHGLQLVDGGVVAAAPAGIAMDKGATDIYVVNVGQGEGGLPPVRGALNILMRTLDTFVAQNLYSDLKRAGQADQVRLHHIHITAFQDLPFNDFNHVDEMIAAGRQATEAYLANPQPRAVAPSSASGQADRGQALHRVPGARQYLPPSYR